MNPKRVSIVATDYPELEKYCPNWNGMKKGMDRLKIPYQFVSCRPDLNIKTIIDFQPDLVIYALRDIILRPDWRQEIRERLPNAKIVMWYGDLRDDSTGQNPADCSEMDAMFVSNDAQGKFYKKQWQMKEVHYLPLGCEPIKKPVPSKMYSFDFVFIGGQISGAGFHWRASLIDKFRREAGLTLVNSFDPKIRARIFKSMPIIYSSSKICLDLSHFTHIQGYTSIRFFEISAFWGFPLTKRFPGCEDLYPEGTRIYWDTFEECIEKRNYYLKHDTERMAIVKKGHAHSYNHTYDIRFKKMFELL